MTMHAIDAILHGIRERRLRARLATMSKVHPWRLVVARSLAHHASAAQNALAQLTPAEHKAALAATSELVAMIKRSPR